MTIKFAIITCSDTRTLETDEAGQKLEQLIAEQGWECIRRVVEMDERPFIAGALIDACDNTDADIVLTCGGSGLSLRDVTPEATRDVADREVPGIAEAMRAHSVAITPFAMLSRAICAQRGHTLIINLPGYMAGLPEEAYLEEFIPAPSTEKDDEAPPTTDDIGLGEV